MENFICQNCPARYTNKGSSCIWTEQKILCNGAINSLGFVQQCETTGYYKK